MGDHALKRDVVKTYFVDIAGNCAILIRDGPIASEGSLMFLRRLERRKNGKPHTYWALAESYRTAKGSRQRIVAYLGELAAGEQDGWAKLGSHLNGKAERGGRNGRCSIRRGAMRRRDDEPLLVKLSSIRLERLARLRRCVAGLGPVADAGARRVAGAADRAGPRRRLRGPRWRRF